MFRSIAAIDLGDLARPPEAGERVRPNVISAVIERQPDYESMGRLVADPAAAARLNSRRTSGEAG